MKDTNHLNSNHLQNSHSKGSQAGSVALQSRKNRWKRWATKKWLFPAIYMTAAMAVMSVMWYYDLQNQATPVTNSSGQVQSHLPVWDDGMGSATNEMTASNHRNGIPVVAEKEIMQWPLIDRSSVDVVLPFYQASSNEPAMVTYQDTVRPHVGIDFAKKDQTTFDVLAAMSGNVKHVVNDPLAGGVIEIVHDDGISSVYQSVTEIKVTVGQEVKQGDLIAKAGQSELEKKQGVHVHFEVRKNGEAIDPSSQIKSE